MPTYRNRDDAPVVQFDVGVEISPFTLFRRLRAGTAPRLIDVRADPASRTLRGAERLPAGSWTPAAEGEEVVLFDDGGSRAVDLARSLQQAGYPGVKALFGGLDLYEFSLDPEVVGADTFLDRD
jgi:rhodanese-related sulfurtransferase